MKRRWLLLAALAAVAVFAAYTYYYSDTLTSINGAYWTTNGAVTATSNGLTAPTTNGGSLISRLTAPGGYPDDYEVKSTLRLTTDGGT